MSVFGVFLVRIFSHSDISLRIQSKSWKIRTMKIQFAESFHALQQAQLRCHLTHLKLIFRSSRNQSIYLHHSFIPWKPENPPGFDMMETLALKGLAWNYSRCKMIKGFHILFIVYCINWTDGTISSVSNFGINQKAPSSFERCNR